jgi:hypothetical protein
MHEFLAVTEMTDGTTGERDVSRRAFVCFLRRRMISPLSHGA